MNVIHLVMMCLSFTITEILEGIVVLVRPIFPFLFPVRFMDAHVVPISAAELSNSFMQICWAAKNNTEVNQTNY